MRAKRYVRVLLTGVLINLVILGLAPAGASSANISHAYGAAGTISEGRLVSLSSNRGDYVELADTDNASRLLGVAVASKDSLIAVDAGSASVQVATSGMAAALVSNLNGPINVGDQVAVSPLKGIGMKALPGMRIIGLAQTGFNANTPGATTEQVKDKSGKNVSFKVGYVQVNIAIDNASSDVNLTAPQRLVKSLTGREVSTLRVVISLAVILVALLALLTLIYASIYSGIIAVGRNPMANSVVFRRLWLVLGMALLTLAIAGSTIYLLLW